MLLATLALLLAEPNAAVAVVTNASASATAPTEVVETAETSDEPQPERICHKRYGGAGIGLIGANKARKVCKTRAEWAANGAPAR